jgi:uncharacterized lipoprotein YmbA
MMSRRRAVLMTLIPVLAWGCVSGRRAQSVYALNEALDDRAEIDASVAGPELQLQRVLVPDYLDTTDILLRAGAHELRTSSSGRWGERLSVGMTRALRADLAVRLPQDRVVLAQPAEKSLRQILVTVDAFDVWPDGHCVLAASWTLLDRESRAVLTAGRGTFITPPVGGGTPGDGAIIKDMADAVGQLADSIASAVKAPSPRRN